MTVESPNPCNLHCRLVEQGCCPTSRAAAFKKMFFVVNLPDLYWFPEESAATEKSSSCKSTPVAAICIQSDPLDRYNKDP